MSDFNQAKYIQEYQKENYDRCIFNLPKGEKEKLNNHWKKKGYESLNQYINKLIKDDMTENPTGGGVIKKRSLILSIYPLPSYSKVLAQRAGATT